MELLYRNECYQIIGACFEVYKEKGCGFVESVYQECLSLELACREIPHQQQVTLKLDYKGRQLRQTYRPDYLCFDEIVVELKAVSLLRDEHRAQVHNYLKASKYTLGLLVNFGHFPNVEWERIVRTSK